MRNGRRPARGSGSSRPDHGASAAADDDNASIVLGVAIGTPISAISALANSPERLSVRCGRVRVATIDRADAIALGLRVGGALTPELADALRAAADRSACRDAALKTLARRPRSVRDLSRRLERAGFASPVVRGVCARLIDERLLDDERFATLWVDAQLRRRATGRSLLLRGLMRAGIERTIADRTVAAATRGSDPLAEATALAKRKVERLTKRGDPHAEVRRLAGMLARRGYDAGVCFTAAKAALGARAAKLDDADID